MVSLEAVAWRLLNRGQPQSAQRVIFSGGGETRRLATEALDLAHMLVSAGHRVLLIDWSGASRVIPSRLGLVVREGLAEAVTSDIGFDTVVHATRVEGLDYIGTGTPVDVFREPRAVEAGRRAQMLLEALDRNYEVIVLVADEAEARTLLRLLNGGFDAAVEVAHATRSGEANSAEYLGLRVSGLEILRYRPNASARAPIRDGRARAASEKAASA
jgi:hypothetical protein